MEKHEPLPKCPLSGQLGEIPGSYVRDLEAVQEQTLWLMWTHTQESERIWDRKAIQRAQSDMRLIRAYNTGFLLLLQANNLKFSPTKLRTDVDKLKLKEKIYVI